MAQNILDIEVRIYDEVAGVDVKFSSTEQAQVKISDDVSLILSLRKLVYEKKISSPCYATAEIHVNRVGRLTLQQLVDLFKRKKVDLTNKATGMAIGANYFVYKATPSEDKNGNVSVVLEIYSLDKLLDIVKYSYAYTARKLRAEILPDAVTRCKMGNLSVPVSTTDQLVLLIGKDKAEFAQPYVVQYNETAYSMLSRTANRCGEFFYFENGALHMGLPSSIAKDAALELGSGDTKLDFLSVSCSDSVASTFGNDQEFLIDDYHEPSVRSFSKTAQSLADGMDNFTIALNCLLGLMLQTHSKYNDLKNGISVFRQNADYYDCYYKAKSAQAGYLHYKDEVQKTKTAIDAYKYNAITRTFPDGILKDEFEPYMRDAIAIKDKDYQAALDEQKKNDYYHKKLYVDKLAKNADEAKKEWIKAQAEGAEDVDEKLAAYREADSTYENEKKKYKPDIDTLVKREVAKIEGLDIELKSLRSDLKEWKNEYISPDTKKKLLEKYKKQITERLKKRYDVLVAKKKELEKARDNQLKEPAVYTKYKDSNDQWKKFSEWKKVITEEEACYKDRLKTIWENTLESGKNRFPIDVKECAKTLKSCAGTISSDINDPKKISTVLKDTKKKDEALGYCKTIISYCDAYIALLDKKTNVTQGSDKKLRQVYDFEYANDEYLQKVKKDGKGTYNDFFCYSLTRDQDTSDYAAWVIIGLVSRFLTTRSTKTEFFTNEVARNVKAASLAAMLRAAFKSKYNNTHITNYMVNGVKAADAKFKDGDEVSMFTTYTRTVGNSEASSVGMSEAFKGVFYKAVYIAERSLEDQKITIRVDCASNKKEAQLGNKIKYNDKVYVVVGVNGSLTANDGISRMEQVVEAIPLFADKLMVPTAIAADRFCKSAPQIATVAADNDPTFEGRVRVRFHWQDSKDEASPWLRVGTPYATKGGGMLFIPQVGDQVMLDFERGNVERPFVTTSLYNEGDKITPPTTVSKGPRRQTISSANGHGITFTDKKNGAFLTEAFCSLSSMSSLGGLFNFGAKKNAGGGVEISDSYGFYSINCSADKRNISISSPLGDIDLNAFTGITIKAPNGDLKIEAKNIEINAGNELKLVSGTYLKDEIDYEAKDYKETFGSAVVKTAIASTIGTIDLSLIRHVLERFLRPVSASTMIKSYRFMVLDSGQKDMNFKNLIDTKSRTVRVKSYKGWSEKPDDIVNLNAEDESIGDKLKKQAKSQVANIGKSIVPEYNLWQVQSEKNAIIVAGDMYSTNTAKNRLAEFSQGKLADDGGVIGEDGIAQGIINPSDENTQKRYDNVGTTLGTVFVEDIKNFPQNLKDAKEWIGDVSTSALTWFGNIFNKKDKKYSNIDIINSMKDLGGLLEGVEDENNDKKNKIEKNKGSDVRKVDNEDDNLNKFLDGLGELFN